jgi:hypothetical protein
MNGLQELIKGLRPSVKLSCNNFGGKWTTPCNLCDYGLAELAKAHATPAQLARLYVTAVPPGKRQVFTMPKEANISAEDIRLTRWGIAYAYALGQQMMVPWDIYLPTPQARRFYGNASQFADLYDLVRRNPNLFEGSEMVGPLGPAGFTLSHTGAEGDGSRWRTPWDTTPAPGQILNNTNLDGCLAACAAEPATRCVGFFLGEGGTRCGLLQRLELISGTAEAGLSYTRNASAPGPVADTGSSGLAALSRRLPAGASGLLAVVHVVAWPAGAVVGPDPGHALVRVDTGRLLGQSLACARQHWSVLWPGAPTPQPLRVPVSCAGNETRLTLVEPLQPWLVLSLAEAA